MEGNKNLEYLVLDATSLSANQAVNIFLAPENRVHAIAVLKKL